MTTNGARIRLLPTANHDVTGLNTGANDGKIVFLTNTSGSFNVTFKDANVGSLDVNRFEMGADYVLAPGKTVVFIHENGHWHLPFSSGAGDNWGVKV